MFSTYGGKENRPDPGIACAALGDSCVLNICRFGRSPQGPRTQGSSAQLLRPRAPERREKHKEVLQLLRHGAAGGGTGTGFCELYGCGVIILSAGL